MKVGDLVRHSIYGERQGLIIAMFKPTGHRDYQCDVLWVTGKLGSCHATLLRVIK